MKSDNDYGDALLLVDLQNDFVEGGALAVEGGLDVIAVANRLMPRFDLVIATADWHPADHRSFASQNAGIEVGDQFMLGGIPQIAWPDHCVQNSHGANFVAALQSDRIQHIVRKGTDRRIDSYSGFYDNDRKSSTGLTEHLKALGVRELCIMGLATDYCVLATVLDAIAEGFRVSLITDGCRGVDLNAGDCDAALVRMHGAGARLIVSGV